MPDADPVARLLSLIEPVPAGEDFFRVELVDATGFHLFGGLVAAQALRAAQRTVDPIRHAQSVHAYFLRRGDPTVPLDFEVHRDTDGRSFSARRVAVEQLGRPIFTMICSFHVPEDAGERLLPLPDGLPNPEDVAYSTPSEFTGALDVREVVTPGVDRVPPHFLSRFWARVPGDLPDDQAVHDALLLYVSDIGTPWDEAAPPGDRVGPSLDHAVWFHRRARIDRWHYVDLEPQSAADARGVYLGRIWDADGGQVATVAQENLIRRAPGEGKHSL